MMGEVKRYWVKAAQSLLKQLEDERASQAGKGRAE